MGNAEKAAAAEAVIEGTFVKISLELNLDATKVDDLGRFRQSFQQLRESIRDNCPLPWPNAACPEYVTFKTLAITVADLLNQNRRKNDPPSNEVAAKRLIEITSNKWEKDWILPRHR
jgi:hypothetical protein